MRSTMVEVSRMWLAMVYVVAFMANVASYGHAPPADFVAQWAHNALCLLSAATWLVMALYQLASWIVAWLGRETRG